MKYVPAAGAVKLAVTPPAPAVIVGCSPLAQAELKTLLPPPSANFVEKFPVVIDWPTVKLFGPAGAVT